MKSRLLRHMCGAITPEFPGGVPMAPGDVIDHPDAWRGVLAGYAEPADEECEQAVFAKVTPERLARAPELYQRAVRGIHPEDFERYERGEILGYNPDGSYIPGPNYTEDEEDDDSDP